MTRFFYDLTLRPLGDGGRPILTPVYRPLTAEDRAAFEHEDADWRPTLGSTDHFTFCREAGPDTADALAAQLARFVRWHEEPDRGWAVAVSRTAIGETTCYATHAVNLDLFAVDLREIAVDVAYVCAVEILARSDRGEFTADADRSIP